MLSVKLQKMLQTDTSLPYNCDSDKLKTQTCGANFLHFTSSRRSKRGPEISKNPTGIFEVTTDKCCQFYEPFIQKANVIYLFHIMFCFSKFFARPKGTTDVMNLPRTETVVDVVAGKLPLPLVLAVSWSVQEDIQFYEGCNFSTLVNMYVAQ